MPVRGAAYPLAGLWLVVPVDRGYSSAKSAAAHKAAFTKAMNATIR